MVVNRRSECVVCNLFFDSMKDFLKHTLSSEHQEIIREMIMEFDEADPIEPPPKAKRASPIDLTIPENMVRMYNPDEDEYFLIPKTKTKTKDNTKDIINLKPELQPKHKDNIYSGINYECKKCNKEFRNEIALTRHLYSQNCKYLENAEYFHMNSIQNMTEFYITDKARKLN